MKKIKMFMLDTCPYCKAALGWMDELFALDPEYKAIEIEIIEEKRQAEIADKYDYYYVPTYYVDEVKLHEGAATYEIVKSVLDSALNRV